MRPPLPGTRFEHEVTPSAGDTAAAFGNEGVEVVATPALIGFIEQTCHLLLEPYYEPGERTVGVRVEVDHLAPARIGQAVTLSAELLTVEGRRLVFAVEVMQAGRRIMQGRHTRAAVRLERFATGPDAAPEKKAEARPAAPKLDFWFDVTSPWCYLAAERIGDIARRHRAALAWRPVHLARLNKRIGGRRPLEENAAFVKWYQQDLLDWAELQGLKADYHPDFPLRPARALRACLYAADEGRAEAFVRRLLRAYWSEAADISDLEVLESLAEDAGLSGARAVEAATDGHRKARLEANLEEAVKTGLFGLPSVVAGGKIFFGNDHLDLLERHLSRLRA
ncbi:MAG: DsbA family protein [Rhodospirillales bacterium]|nr:DsbA family protein [Rhodospirillales bacterium]